jgi:hypothetical protein
LRRRSQNARADSQPHTCPKLAKELGPGSAQGCRKDFSGRARFDCFAFGSEVFLIGMRTNLRRRAVFCTLFWLELCFASAHAQTNPSPNPNSVAVVDAGLGSCSADFIINDAAGSPVYAATIRVHIAYGFLSAHKLDLQVGTNAAGKARFIGLPDQSKRGLFFQASEGDREGSAFDDPAKTCKADFTIALRKKSE